MTKAKETRTVYPGSRRTDNNFILYNWDDLSPAQKGKYKAINNSFKKGEITKDTAQRYFDYHGIKAIHTSDIPY